MVSQIAWIKTSLSGVVGVFAGALSGAFYSTYHHYNVVVPEAKNNVEVIENIEDPRMDSKLVEACFISSAQSLVGEELARAAFQSNNYTITLNSDEIKMTENFASCAKRNMNFQTEQLVHDEAGPPNVDAVLYSTPAGGLLFGLAAFLLYRNEDDPKPKQPRIGSV